MAALLLVPFRLSDLPDLQKSLRKFYDLCASGCCIRLLVSTHRVSFGALDASLFDTDTDFLSPEVIYDSLANRARDNGLRWWRFLFFLFQGFFVS